MKTQNWLLLGIGAFALYKIVKASRSNKDASNDGEFKNAVSNQNLVSSKKVNCDCKTQIPVKAPAKSARGGYYIIAYIEMYGKKGEGFSPCVPNSICGSRRFELNPPIYVPVGGIPPISFG